jgi:outer membrane lipoprotein SlyB
MAHHLRLIALLASIACGTMACTNPYSPGQRAAGGALIGAGGGAAIGALAGGGEGAAIGALAGGLTGALVGAATTPERPRYRNRRDCWRRYDGRVVCR